MQRAEESMARSEGVHFEMPAAIEMLRTSEERASTIVSAVAAPQSRICEWSDFIGGRAFVARVIRGWKVCSMERVLPIHHCYHIASLFGLLLFVYTFL